MEESNKGPTSILSKSYWITTVSLDCDVMEGYVKRRFRGIITQYALSFVKMCAHDVMRKEVRKYTPVEENRKGITG